MSEQPDEYDSPELAAFPYEKAKAMFSDEQLTELFLREEPMIPFQKKFWKNWKKTTE